MMDRQIIHMSHIIDDLLDVSRIRGGKVTLRPEQVDLVQLIRQISDSHYPNFQESSVALILALPEEPVWATVDATRLTQVVENLLTNAIKFTNPGGSVTLGLAVEADKNAVLVVRDTGIGIEATMLNRLFDTFAQADRSLDRNRGGLGLGLALVKGLVELHAGTVEASSDGIGHGATFTVRLPLNEQTPATPAAANTLLTDIGKPLYIVLVEDNRDSAESLRMILEVLGHSVTVADSGPAGLQAVREKSPDVVICDIGLPGMDGFAVAETLRQDPRTANVRLLALTGYGGEEYRERSLKAGFNGYLIKPVNPAVLLQQLNPVGS